MANYQAVMMHAATGGEGRYTFEGPDDLMTKTPVRIMRHFMEIVDRDILPKEQIDYELNAAMKSSDRSVVTAMGSLELSSGAPLPFLVMISRVS